MKDIGIGIKDKDGYYFCGLNTWDTQIRKAKLYHSMSYANDVINDLRYKDRKAFTVKIEIKEINE